MKIFYMIFALLLGCVFNTKKDIQDTFTSKFNASIKQNQCAYNDFSVNLNAETYYTNQASNNGRYTLDDISFDAFYNTTNFILYYDSQLIPFADVVQAGQLYEYVRNACINMGFRKPLLKSGKTRFEVGLVYEDDPYCAAYTRAYYSSKTSASFIIHYSLKDGLDHIFAEIVAHEYAHAIQNAYNVGMDWFAEASANWFAYEIFKTTMNADWTVNNFINSSTYLTDYNECYGQFLFPLTLSKRCGGYEIIVKIFENFNKTNATYSNEKMKNVVDKSLKAVNSNDTFESIVSAMFSYMVDCGEWFSGIGNSYDWAKPPKTYKIINNASTSYSFSGRIHSLNSEYISFSIPTNFKGVMNVKVSFENIECYISEYSINNSTKTLAFNGAANEWTSDINGFGYEITDYCLILTNTDLSKEASFKVDYVFYSNYEDVTFQNSKRILERRIFIRQGESAEISIQFDFSGWKIIQTLGTLDTKIGIRNNYGRLLNDINACDDKGYYVNSCVSFLASNTVGYSITISCYSSTQSGYTKLLITDTENFGKEGCNLIKEFSDIYLIENADEYYLSAYVRDNMTQMVLFKPKTTGFYWVDLYSEFDNFLYVLDVSNSQLSVNGIDYDDDGGEGLNASLCKKLIKGNYYLIIFSQYNPCAALNNYELGDDIDVYIYQ